MKRLILSILVGLLVSGILSSAVDHVFHTTGVFPPYGEPNFNNAQMLMAFLYRALFGMLGGYVTTVLARDQDHMLKADGRKVKTFGSQVRTEVVRWSGSKSLNYTPASSVNT